MYYVMSDLHGCHDAFMTALSYWNPEPPQSETLVILGDLIDRGPDSLKVVQTVMKIKNQYPSQVIIVKGNHDEAFANWLMETPSDEYGYYYMPSFNETILSFFDHDKKKYKKASRKQRGEHIVYKYAKEVRFLYNLPMYHETDHIIFVHGGINLKIKDWRDDTRCMNEIRNPFIYSSKTAPKTVFFGHTPTAIIRNDNAEHPNCDIWVSPQGDKIGIDGGLSMNGQLNAVKVDTFGNITNIHVMKQPAQTALTKIPVPTA